MFRKHSRLAILAVITALTTLLVISCGGGDGDSPPARVLTPVSYTGDTSPAAITLANTPTLVTNVLFGGSAASDIPTAVIITEKDTLSGERPTGADQLMNLFHFSMDDILDDTLHGYQLPAAEVINETEYCENVSGYYTVRGTLDDMNNTGTLTFDYYNCLRDGLTFDGMYYAHVHDFDLYPYTYRFNVTMEIVLMNVTAPELNVSMSGTILFDDSVLDYSLIERSTRNYTEEHNISKRMYKYENFVMNAIIDDAFSYDSSGSISYRGTLYDSDYGGLTVVTSAPLLFSSTSRSYPDLGGELVFTGNLSAIQLTVESGRHVKLELDLDGALGYEKVRYVLWSEFENIAMLDLSDITDNDGMHTSWEISFGLDPNIDDAADNLDNDGLTNLEEYQQGYDPSNPLSPTT